MIPVYVIFGRDNTIKCVTRESIDERAQRLDLAIQWGRDGCGTLTKKSGYGPVETFILSHLEA